MIYECYSGIFEVPKHVYLNFFRLFYYSFHLGSAYCFVGRLIERFHEFWNWGFRAYFGWQGSFSVTFPLCTLLGVAQFPLLGPLGPQPRIMSYVGRGLGDSGSSFQVSPQSQAWSAFPRFLGLLQA